MANIERLFPPGAPKPGGHYAPAVKAGGFIFVAGQVPTDPATGQMSLGTIEHETRLVIENIRRILEGCGASLKDVVRCGVFLSDPGDFQAMNRVYAEYFGEDKPARTTVGVQFAAPGLKVEIDCIAYKP